MATAVLSAPLTISHLALPPSSPPEEEHQAADASAISVPYTPTSSGSASLPPSRHPSHRKANSASSPEVTAVPPKRPLSLQGTAAAASMAEDQQRLLGLKLPPSPPLTNREVDELDTAEREHSDSIHDEACRGTTNQQGKARVSHDLPRPRTISVLSSSASHPLHPSSHADIDLEKGPDPTPIGVTKPFEIIRPALGSSPQPPKSSYYLGPPVGPTAYGTPPVGQLGVHYPREIVRVERDYDHGELVQFSSAYPLELQGRITPTQFLETINVLNEGLIRAHSLSSSVIYNTLAILTLWISPLFLQSRYEKEMDKLKYLLDVLNGEVYNPAGLNILWPRRNAFLFLEIEYY